ncbi:MAG: hypothetical protein LBT48_06990 [Prevotellaceae bacterium]|jgi:hypothetical protein|nr:hypothetical protein [Prevotellaceae bacterium]
MNTKKILVAGLLLLTATAMPAFGGNKYAVKSAIIKKEMSVMGQSILNIFYIDNFGAKEAIETTMKNGIAAGVDKHIRLIYDGLSVINIDLDLNTATQTAAPDELQVNYLQLTPEVKEKYKLKETGKENIAGKSCTTYSMEMSQMGVTAHVKAWVWKGIPLKTETSAAGMVITSETVLEIQENVAVPAGKFIVPKGVTMQKTKP